MGRNLIAEAAELLADKMVDFGSYEAIYSSGGDTVPLHAIPGRSTITLGDDQGGSRVIQCEDDWMVRVDDLVLSAGLAEPKLGDTLTIERGRKAGRYEILSPGPGQRHAVKVGSGVLWRLHTKRLGSPKP